MTSKTRLTLDLKDSQSFDTLILHRGDSKSRVIEIELTDDHAPVTLTSGMSATINASTNGIVVADGEKATVDTANNIISFTVTDNMTSLPGQSKISLTVTEGDTVITAQTFRAIVTDAVINEGSKFEPTGGTVKQFMDEVAAARGDYTTLLEAMSKKADKSTTLAGYGITDGENIGNKVSVVDFQNLSERDYPNIKALNNYHTNYVEPCYEEIDNLKESKADKSSVDTALSGKLDDAEGSVKRENIEVNAVGTDEIDSGAVDTVNIADKSVTIAKLSDDLLAYIKSNSGTGNGKSAYEVAIDNGFTGTQEEWLASLKGDKGDKGDAPVKGIDYWTNDDKAEIIGDQATPLFANDISECTDTSRVYLLPDGFLYAYIKTVIEKTAYTNQLPISTDNKGNVYNGVGYTSGRYNSSSTTFGSLKTDEGYYTTGLIPFKMGQTLRIKGAEISELPILETRNIYSSFALVGSSRTTFIGGKYFNWLQHLDTVMDSTSEYYFVKSATVSNDICTFVTDKNTGSSISADDVYYISLSLKVTDPSAVIITVDEEITDEFIEEYDYNWANTGRAYAPADYEDRIVALESKLANFGTDMIYGIVDENNAILMGGTLEVGIYTLKYQNSDGTTTEIGTFEVV